MRVPVFWPGCKVAPFTERGNNGGGRFWRHPRDHAEWTDGCPGIKFQRRVGLGDGVWDSPLYSRHWMRLPRADSYKAWGRALGALTAKSGGGANQIQHSRSKKKTRKPKGQVFWGARDPKILLMSWNYVSDSEHSSFRKSWLEWVQEKMRCEEAEKANINYSLQEFCSKAEQKSSALVGGVCSLKGGILFSLR